MIEMHIENAKLSSILTKKGESLSKIRLLGESFILLANRKMMYGIKNDSKVSITMIPRNVNPEDKLPFVLGKEYFEVTNIQTL